MISQLAEERLKKFRAAVDGANGIPEVLFMRMDSKERKVLVICSGGPLSQELLLEMREAIDSLLKHKGPGNG